MRVRYFFRLFIIITSTFVNVLFSDLSSVIEMGWFLKDKNLDGFPDFLDCKIILPENPSLELIRSASEIAFRLSFESEGITPPIVFTENEIKKDEALHNVILLGDSNLQKSLFKKMGIPYSVPDNSAIIEVFNLQSGSILSIRGSDGASIFYSVKNFFSRFPYIWEIYGRKTGTTFEKIREEVDKFLKEKGVKVEKICFKKIIYENREEIEKREKPFELEFYESDSGEVKILEVEIVVESKKALKDGINAIKELKDSRRFGKKTKILNYSGISELLFIFIHSDSSEKIPLERVGFPERMLSRRLTTELVKVKAKPKTKEISLSNLFSTSGLIKEEEKGVEKLDAKVVLTRSEICPSVAEIASRLGLESTGITMPLTLLDEEIDKFDEIDFNPIITGEKNLLTQYLIKSGKLKLPNLKKEEGLISIVPKAFNNFTAFVICGNIKSASLYFAKHLPFIWKEGKGGMEIFKIEDNINSFFKMRNFEGQASLARKYLKDFLLRNPLENIDILKIEIFLENPEPNFSKAFDDIFGGKQIEINLINSKDERNIFELEREIPYEVDEFWKIWNEEILTKLNPERRVKIDVLLSEPPEIRKSIKEKILVELGNRGFKRGSLLIRVLSAYKQGFSWIVDDVIPKLKGKKIKNFHIIFPYQKINITPAKFQEEPTRWLSELYPVDEIISRELEIPLDSITFEKVESEKPLYKVKVEEEDGKIFEESFSPLISKRSYLDRFPSWGEVTITTGGVLVEEDGKEIFKKAIKTDLQKFWEFYQKEVLEKLYEHTVKKTGGKPRIDKQPFFKKLKVELFASEPDYRLGVDEEMITSLESIHDEIYFDTLDFLEAIVLKEKLILEEKDIQKRFNASGKIVPVIHPSIDGKPAKVRVQLTDFQSDKPKIRFKWRDKKGKEREEEKTLEPLSLSSCKATEVIVREDKVSSLGLSIKFSKEENATAFDIVEGLKELREKGYLKDFIPSNFLERINLYFQFESFQSSNFFNISQAKNKNSPRYRSNLVRFDHVISPEEALEISKALGTLPEIYTYTIWKSFEGRDIPVMEISLSSPSEVFSRNKKILRKPTLLLTGRQHGNEVSSTSYLLKLAELLATDKKWKEYLKKINVVIHPVENPDGAALAHELQKITPYFCLHAGRYTALGADVSTQIKNPETILSEALFRNFLYERWKPDIYLNLHGYPSHEWIQQFSGYTPYLFRQYWIPRGWYAFITHLEHPGYPFHSEASMILLEYVNREINSQIDISKRNISQYRRYIRWAERWEPHIHFLEFHGETNLYFERRSSRATKPSQRRDITLWEAVTEAMDETAQGKWLDFVCLQGLSFLKAHLDFLFESKAIMHREEEEEHGRISITLTRVRPVRLER